MCGKISIVTDGNEYNVLQPLRLWKSEGFKVFFRVSAIVECLIFK